MEQAVDELDRRIIGRLQLDGRESVSALARDLRQDRRTVFRRIQNLVESGILRFAIATDPRILGYKSMALVCLTVDSAADVEQVYDTVCSLPEVTYATQTTGRFAIQAEVIGADNNDLRRVLAQRFGGFPEIRAWEVLYCLRIHFQRTWFGVDEDNEGDRGIRPFETSPVDRKLITLLATDGRMTFKALASRLGVSESLVRKRYGILTSANVIRVAAVVNPLHMGFTLVCWAAITVAPGGRVSQIAEALTEIGEVAYIAITAGSIDLMVEVVCASHEHLIELLDSRIRPIDGVDRAEIWIYLRLTHKPILPRVFADRAVRQH